MRRIAAIACALSLAGCSLKTRAELAAEQSGHAQASQTIAQQRETAAEGPAQGVSTAPPAPVVHEEDMDTQMRTLTGRIDTLENVVSQQSAAKQGEQDNIVKEKAAITQKFQAYEEALKKLEGEVAALNEEVVKLKTAPPPSPPAPVVEAAPVVKKNAYGEGEERFAAKKWKEAIVSYQKYRDSNPKGSKFADSTYKIGVSFQELGMKDEARAFYEEVNSKYPKSAEARKASIRLKTLK